jgi:hypothetical protein
MLYHDAPVEHRESVPVLRVTIESGRNRTPAASTTRTLAE